MSESSGGSRDGRGDPRPPHVPRKFEIPAFLGASLLVAALLVPHARVLSVGGGIALAGVLRWGWSRLGF